MKTEINYWKVSAVCLMILIILFIAMDTYQQKREEKEYKELIQFALEKAKVNEKFLVCDLEMEGCNVFVKQKVTTPNE